MMFKSKRALDFLLRNGIVATMRNTKYRLGQVVRINRELCGVIIEIHDNTRANRGKFVKISGFNTVEEWENEARKLHKGKLPRRIYIVKLLSHG